jgi:hypothetical protein
LQLIFLIIVYLSPHHGKSICDIFGAEFREVLDTSKLKNSAKTYEEFFSLCQKMYQSNNFSPGEKRVSFIKFVHLLQIKIYLKLVLFFLIKIFLFFGYT